MSAIETVQTFITALQSNDLEMAATIMSDDFCLSGLADRDIHKNEFLVTQSELHAGLSDFNYNLADLQQQGDHVKGSIAISGTHTQELNLPLFDLKNLAATGISIQLPQVAILFEFHGEHISSMQIESVPGGGMDGIVQQLGTEVWIPRRVNEEEEPSF